LEDFRVKKVTAVSNVVQVQNLTKTAAGKSPPKESEFRRVARLMGRFLIGQRKVFVMAFVMLLAEAITAIYAAYPLSYLIDFLKGDRPDVFQALGVPAFITPYTGTIAILTTAIVLMATINSLADSLSEIYLARGGRMLGFNLRVGLYDHLQKLSLAFFNQQRTGDILTRVTSDVTALEEFVISSLSDLVGSLLVLVGTLAYLLYRSWEVALVAALLVPAIALISNHFAQLIKSASKKQRAREGDLASAAQEMLTSIRVIQTYGRGGNELKSFAEQNQKTMDVALETARIQAIFSWVVKVLEALSTIGIIWLGVWLINQSTLTVGTLVLFVILIDQMFKPTKKIIKQWNTFGKMYASAERIGELLDRRPAVEDLPGAVEAPQVTGQVEYRHVSFAYQVDPEDGQPGVPQMRLALHNLSLTISPGETVALVGGSGAGKSTIVQLLPRLYDPHLGQVLIDGHDIREWTLESLRSQMSMVLQETVLFTGTVAENIAYGRDNATQEEIIAAAIQANAHEFIEKLPKGYNTVLGERAANLSGGQRQRIAIARAFIRNTPILILDEPTTGLDAESTDLVLTALRTLMKGKATIIVSHDLNLIRNADKILVVKDGEVAQAGTHKELLRVGGLYADLYHKQFGQAVQEVGGKIVPAEEPRAPVIAPPAPVRQPQPEDAEDAMDDDETPAVAPQVFQTMMTKALPQPVSVQTFQTLMMQAVPPAAPAATPVPGAPAAQISPASAQAAQAGAAAVGAPIVAPVKAAPSTPTAAPQAAQTAAAGEATPIAASAASSTPAATSPGPKTAPPAASATPAATSQPKADEPAKPKPAIFATTLMHTIPPPATDHPATAPESAARPEATPARPEAKSTILLSADELRAFQDNQATPEADQPLDDGQLDPQLSPALRQELPGMATAFDNQAMQGYLQAALLGTSNSRFTITSCSSGEAGLLPDGTCTLRYLLDIHDRETGETQRQLVGARIFRNQLACAIYMRDKLAPLAALMRGRDEIASFASPAALIEPLHMAVHAFPIDGELPTLIGATDRDRVAGVLSETLPESLDETFDIERCEVELVDYARQKRAVLRYQVEGRRPGEERIEHRTVYGKVFADGSGALAGPITVALRERVAASGYRINVPQSYAWRPDLQLSLLEAIPGEPPISDMLKARLRGKPTPNTALSLEQMIDHCGRIAALLHTSNIRLGPRRSFDDEIAALRQELAPILRFSPALGARLQGWLERIETYAEQSDSLPLGFSHGDFTAGQLVFDGATPGLVDFDSFCQAEPALDLGQFLAYLRVAGTKKDQTGDAGEVIAQIGERFLTSYIAAAGESVEDADRLRVRVSVYTIISLLRRTMRSWQKFKGSRTASALAILEEEIACLPQLDY
jgi:ABC-type multidrug transport system fused ATPase/permease subunit